MDNILLLLIVIIIINIYMIFIQYKLLYKNDIKLPIKSDFIGGYMKREKYTKKKTTCNNPKIINDIKQYYKKTANNNNDFNSVIEQIIKINLITDSLNGTYCDVLYKLNNNNDGNRRFSITTDGDIIGMGVPGSGRSVI
jgi:hypothetical protein